MKELKDKIENGSAVIGIMGLGYVGLPLAAESAKKGYKTYGFDINGKRIEELKRGEIFITYLDRDAIAEQIKNGLLIPTGDFSHLGECDLIQICVPTPLTSTREPDLEPVIVASEQVAKHLRKGQLIILTSTTYPGTTREVLIPILEKTGMKAGKDFLAAFAPEREDPGNKSFKTAGIAKVVGGLDKASLECAVAFLSKTFEKVVPVETPEEAEFTKLLENIYRSVNIAMINELKMLAHRMGINIWNVIGAASTKPFGFQPFYPGPGLGGHCIPIDPFYLTWKAREFDFSTKFIELSGEINSNMPYYIVERIAEGLNLRKKSINSSKLLILGVSYKKDVGDIRESPALKIIQLLKDRGGIVDYNDPYVPELEPHGQLKEHMISVGIDDSDIKKYDAVIITTDHSSYDYQRIVDKSSLVIDCRNATRDVKHGKEKTFPA
jgi:UDP-N-acetyl-D-glucosamine dehydrogenase